MDDSRKCEAEQRQCRFIDRCPMFPLFAEESSLERYQSQYCRSDFEQCERFKWASIGKMPNPKLLPDGGWLSRELASEDGV
jgi:hypothetical protein